jgi:hypothetical protein
MRRSLQEEAGENIEGSSKKSLEPTPQLPCASGAWCPWNRVGSPAGRRGGSTLW